jgi:L-lysine exporter family protein LysE/ArgO
MLDTSIWLQGFILGLAMFVAPGPKDILILRETLAGQSPLLLIAIAVGTFWAWQERRAAGLE